VLLNPHSGVFLCWFCLGGGLFVFVCFGGCFCLFFFVVLCWVGVWF